LTEALEHGNKWGRNADRIQRHTRGTNEAVHGSCRNRARLTTEETAARLRAEGENKGSAPLTACPFNDQ